MNEACTIVLRGASSHILDEAERSLHDALCVLQQTVKESRTVYGGGCSEMLMAKAVEELAAKTPGKRALAVEAFARALRQIPTIIADNAGYDSADLVSEVRFPSNKKRTKQTPSLVLDISFHTAPCCPLPRPEHRRPGHGPGDRWRRRSTRHLGVVPRQGAGAQLSLRGSRDDLTRGPHPALGTTCTRGSSWTPLEFEIAILHRENFFFTPRCQTRLENQEE